MPATRNTRKKNKFESSSIGQDSRNSKRLRKRVNSKVQPGENVHNKQVATSTDDAHQLSKLADAQAPIISGPVPVAQSSTLEVLPFTPLTSSSYPSVAPAPMLLKGRKRFSADLHDLHTTCPSDLDRGTWSAHSKRGLASSPIHSPTNIDLLRFQSRGRRWFSRVRPDRI